LESQVARNVVMHFFSSREQLRRVVDNDWYITIKRILLETDAPWLDLEGRRNEPIAIKGFREGCGGKRPPLRRGLASMWKERS
jgi:Tat protein secretion system quality control protein TatD with DNase activity